MERSAKIFKALADPTRRQILSALKERELRAGEIVDLFTMSAPAVSRHLTVLKNADLVQERREGNAIVYQLAPEQFGFGFERFLELRLSDRDPGSPKTGPFKEVRGSMKIGITGGTGFIGSHLAARLVDGGHEVVLIARGQNPRWREYAENNSVRFIPIGLGNPDQLQDAFRGCDAVAHCAGINRELRSGDYERVHIQGTQNVVTAGKRAGVKKIVSMSFFRARPDCGSPYHESKFAAEEIVRSSDLDYTVIKAGMVYGRGDHMLDHLSHVFYTLPIFGLVGFSARYAAPLAIDDLTLIMENALTDNLLSGKTVAVIGPERLSLEAAVRRVASVVGRTPYMVRMPIVFHKLFASFLERTMKVPLIAQAQVRILSEGFDEPYGEVDALPTSLLPTTRFTKEKIREGLPPPGPFRISDLRCCFSSGTEVPRTQ